MQKRSNLLNYRVLVAFFFRFPNIVKAEIRFKLSWYIVLFLTWFLLPLYYILLALPLIPSPWFSSSRVLGSHPILSASLPSSCRPSLCPILFPSWSLSSLTSSPWFYLFPLLFSHSFLSSLMHFCLRNVEITHTGTRKQRELLSLFPPYDYNDDTWINPFLITFCNLFDGFQVCLFHVSKVVCTCCMRWGCNYCFVLF